jgi:hypothetical protein
LHQLLEQEALQLLQEQQHLAMAQAVAVAVVFHRVKITQVVLVAMVLLDLHYYIIKI